MIFLWIIQSDICIVFLFGYGYNVCMSRRQIKVKVEKGNIIPLEPIDSNTAGEGLVIFLDDYLDEEKSILKMITNDPSNSELFSDDEDLYTFSDGKPLND